MINPQPSKIFRGNVDEVFSHRDEIPPGAFLELRVFEPAPEEDDRRNRLSTIVSQSVG
jgi:hypothetical protein